MTPDWLVLGGAALTGLLGGAHCAAMCGGIATSLTVAQRGGWWVALQPNLGRIAGYVLAGALVGAFGHGLLGVARIPGLATAMRVGVGIVLVLAAIRLLDRNGRTAFLRMPGAAAWQRLRPLQRRLLPANTAARPPGSSNRIAANTSTTPTATRIAIARPGMRATPSRPCPNAPTSMPAST